MNTLWDYEWEYVPYVFHLNGRPFVWLRFMLAPFIISEKHRKHFLSRHLFLEFSARRGQKQCNKVIIF